MCRRSSSIPVVVSTFRTYNISLQAIRLTVRAGSRAQKRSIVNRWENILILQMKLSLRVKISIHRQRVNFRRESWTSVSLRQRAEGKKICAKTGSRMFGFFLRASLTKLRPKKMFIYLLRAPVYYSIETVGDKIKQPSSGTAYNVH